MWNLEVEFKAGYRYKFRRDSLGECIKHLVVVVTYSFREYKGHVIWKD